MHQSVFRPNYIFNNDSDSFWRRTSDIVRKKIWMFKTLIAWQDRMSDHHFWPPHFCVYLSFFVMFTNSRQSVKWYLIGQITCACNIC